MVHSLRTTGEMPGLGKDGTVGGVLAVQERGCVLRSLVPPKSQLWWQVSVIPVVDPWGPLASQSCQIAVLQVQQETPC